MSVERGHTAEDLAAVYLEETGFAIIARNWRNRWCEIDIVAKRAKAIHFVEVKYRRRAEYGSAVEYVTADKQQRLQRAALAWVQANRWHGPFQVDVIAIDGELPAAEVAYLPNAVTD